MKLTDITTSLELWVKNWYALDYWDRAFIGIIVSMIFTYVYCKLIAIPYLKGKWKIPS